MSATYIEHVVKGGGERDGRWDLLAFAYYGDVSRQKDILRANRGLFLDPGGTPSLGAPPAVLKPGTVVRIPILDVPVDDSNLPPWKRGRSIRA